ncbi:LamG-like jellyroll fold domain-containing protein [Streptomyces sp. A1-5]|uniref:LamG-like jellyroll fold domain-containing protein n=1 Tax=Streptomyces sp. A1-5 TaxID=2738410 RepID=UPI001F252C2A|nr:LamG-like jellyroll fold domain-containing protein [Streptomyces sp. A1-5]UJB40359.1 trypsin-like serine protease [Streptomyces sp. A1-5]
MAGIAQAAGEGLGSLVEDYAYPDRDKLLAEKGLKLVSGDGNITLADCASGNNLVRIHSRDGGLVCFATSGPVGYLAMEIEKTYLAKSEDRDDVTATVRIEDARTQETKVQKIDLGRGQWKELGEGGDPKLKSTLLELSVGQGKQRAELSGDAARPWLARVTVNEPGHEGGRSCSGALVDASWVLTAASCFAADPAKPGPVVGATAPNAAALLAGHAPVKIQYLVPRDDRDVVLARLATPITNVSPATLAGSAPSNGAALVATGFGRTDTTWVPNSPHSSNLTQSSTTATTMELTGGRTCKGDAGGPIMDGSGRITAVQSRASHAGCLGQPGEGTTATAARIDNIADWLDNNSFTGKTRLTLDEVVGLGRVSGGVPGEFVAELAGGAELGAAGKVGSALKLNGSSGYAATAGPVVDTTKSFSVSAWVKLDNKDRNHTFLSQAGDRASGFQLYYSKDLDKWVFNRHTNDTDNTTIARALSKDVAQAGVWTHLTGTYDADKQTLALYVNGQLQQSTKFTSSWRAGGGLQIGRVRYRGGWQENMSGLIDDVRLVQSAATDADAQAITSGKLPSYLQQLATFTLDEVVGSGRVSGGVPGEFVAELAGGAELGAAGKVGSALKLNGSSGYAATAGPVVDTTKSFSVSAWVKLDNKDRNHTFLSQAGDRASGFQLYYSKDLDKWVFNRHATDTDNTAIVRTVSKDVAQAGVWTHLTGTYDADKQTLALYVNGQLQQSTKFTSSWRAGGGLQIGRVRYRGGWQENMSGLIDDVRLVQSAATDADAQAITSGEPPAQLQELATFPLDEKAGSVRVSGGKGAGSVATLAGDGIQLGAEGKFGTALHLNGTSGYAATAGPMVDTTKSFSVSAWVKLDNKDRNHTFLSQAGDRASGFQLYYSKDLDKWVFNRHASDTDNTSIVRSTSADAAQTGVWTELTGVYDDTAKTLQLFVNGKPQTAVSFTTPWQARGALQIGRLLYKGTWQEHFAGTIDNIRIWDQTIGADDIVNEGIRVKK